MAERPAPCKWCNDEGVVHTHDGEVIGPCECVPQEWTNDVVSDHVASIVFDGEEYEPECVLCQKAVGLGYFAHFGYEVEACVSNPPESGSTLLRYDGDEA